MGDSLGILGAAVGAVVGLLIGSFLTVVVHRVPAGKSVVRPGSACPACGRSLGVGEKIPLLSWALQRGGCRACGARIPARYPLLEAGTAAAFAGVGWWVSGDSSPPRQLVDRADNWGPLVGALVVVAYLWLAASSLALTAIDLDHHRLPNAIVLPGYAVVGVGLLLPTLLVSDWARAGAVAGGAVVLLAAYAVLAWAWPGGMGAGDVKLAGVLGAFLGASGWGALAVGGLGAFVLGGAASLSLIISRRATIRSGIPFGPWMLMGAWVGIIGGEPLATAYLSLFGISGT